ncbi:hypothetical protein [Pectobacterium aroidearum]|uniref:hypothetical protein n=1 Tax=Pectobacterium aroidearum TaxID=1201031 RepID=UPI003019215F
MKHTSNDALPGLRPAMRRAAKNVTGVVVGSIAVVLILAAILWLIELAGQGLTYVWPRHPWALSMTAAGMVGGLLALSEFIRLTLVWSGLMRKKAYDLRIGLFFGGVVALSWALCAALIWMLFHLQGNEGDMLHPLMVVSVIVSLLYPFILLNLLKDA